MGLHYCMYFATSWELTDGLPRFWWVAFFVCFAAALEHPRLIRRHKTVRKHTDWWVLHTQHQSFRRSTTDSDALVQLLSFRVFSRDDEGLEWISGSVRTSSSNGKNVYMLLGTQSTHTTHRVRSVRSSLKKYSKLLGFSIVSVS